MKDVRERRERERAVRDQTNVAGTTLGKIMGVKEETEQSGEGRSDVQSDAFTAKATAKEEEGDGDRDARADGQYGEHMRKPNEAVSEFARTKTLAEQRAFLPIYGVRQVHRDPNRNPNPNHNPDPNRTLSPILSVTRT